MYTYLMYYLGLVIGLVTGVMAGLYLAKHMKDRPRKEKP